MDIIGGNKIFFILAICLMGLMFSSCDTHFFKARLESGEINKYHRPLSADIKTEVYREQSSSDHRRFECNMDTSINEISLMSQISLDSIFSLNVDNYIVNDFQHGEGVCISNTSNTEFVFFKFNNGRIGQELDAFILTDSIPLEFSPYKIQSRVPKFITTYGAYIGMSKTDFINKYFSDNESKKKLGSIYAQYDSIYFII